MRLFRLLTLRSMRSRSLRFLLSTFGIILGVAGMLSIQATNQTALTSILNLFESTSGRAKLVVSSSDANESGFSEKLLTRINSVEGVLVADPLVIENTDLADKEASNQLDISFFAASDTPPGASVQCAMPPRVASTKGRTSEPSGATTTLSDR